MTSKEDVDAEHAGAGPKTVAEVVDIKPKSEGASARMVTADGRTREIEDAGDIAAHLGSGNIVIDPALVEKAVKGGGGQPMTVAEALQQGDYAAAARMIQAQIARAANGDFDGARYEDIARFAGLDEKKLAEERIKAREAELSAYYDARGGYRDRYGGYFNANDNTYTDQDGGTVDNFGGYRYKDGSYKSKFGDYYDASTRTYYGANGEKTKIPGDMTNDDVVKEMQDTVKKNGGYDPNFIRNGQIDAADAEHPSPASAGGSIASKEGRNPNAVQETAAKAKADRGPDPSAMPATLKPGTSMAEKLAARRAASAQAAAPGGSKFSTGSSGTGDASPGNTADVSSSTFFAVDTSISTSKFPLPPAAADVPDPEVTAGTTSAKRPAAKNPAP